MSFCGQRWKIIFSLLGAFSLWIGQAVAATPNYQLLTLEDCLSLAREHNPVLSASRDKIRELVADYEAARSTFFPRLVLISYYDRQPPNRMAISGQSAMELFKREGYTSVTGKQLLFDGLKTYYSTKAARIGVQAQRQEVQKTADEVIYQVTEAFYRLLAAKEELQVARKALQERQEFAKLTEAFFQVGKVTRLDNFRAQSQVSEAEQGQVEASHAVVLAREILGRTIGLDEQTQVDIRGQLPRQFSPAKAVELLWQEAKKNNPEIRRLDLDIAQSQTVIKAARSGYFPELSLQASADVRHRDLGGTKPEWLAGVFMEYPFFEGGLTKAQVAKASSQYRQLVEKKRDRLNSLKADLAAAWKDQEDSRQGVDTAKQTLITNEEAYASANSLYRHGKAIALDVLTAEVELTRSRLSLIRYQTAYGIAQARLRQLIGSEPSTGAASDTAKGVIK